MAVQGTEGPARAPSSWRAGLPSARYFPQGPGGLPRADPASLFPGHTVRGLLGPLAVWTLPGLGGVSRLRGTPVQVTSLGGAATCTGESGPGLGLRTTLMP